MIWHSNIIRQKLLIIIFLLLWNFCFGSSIAHSFLVFDSFLFCSSVWLKLCHSTFRLEFSNFLFVKFFLKWLTWSKLIWKPSTKGAWFGSPRLSLVISHIFFIFWKVFSNASSWKSHSRHRSSQFLWLSVDKYLEVPKTSHVDYLSEFPRLLNAWEYQIYSAKLEKIVHENCFRIYLKHWKFDCFMIFSEVAIDNAIRANGQRIRINNI